MITPIKHAAKFLNGAAFKPSDWGDEGFPIIRIAQLTGKPFDNFFAGEINRGIHVHDGDLLFSWSATIDAFIWQRGDGILNQHIFKVVPKRGAEKQYLYYLIKAHAPRWADDDAHGSTMKHIKKDALSNKVWLPDLSTQKAIADFLDREITRIDALMQKKAILIPLLREKQRSAITLAVTSGIDPKASMKDSDIPWMSSIPEHWTVSKLGYLGRLSNGISIGGDAFGSGFPFVSYGDVYKNRSLPSSASGLVLSSEKDRKSYDVKTGDVFFTRTSETVEEIGFASVCLNTIHDAVFAGFLIRFRPRKNVLSPQFSKFAFQHEGLRHYFASKMNIITRASLSQDLLRNVPVPLPPISEQIAIADHLQQVEMTVEALIERTERSIVHLKELRASLITAAVTGQIDPATYRRNSTTDRALDRIAEEIAQ